MYQQGYQEGSSGNGQDRAWYAPPPRTDAAAPRRRSRSRSQAGQDAAPQAPSAAPVTQPTAAPAYEQPQTPLAAPQAGYGYANNGISHPADQPGGYGSFDHSYSAPNSLYQQPGYGQQSYSGYPQSGYGGEGYGYSHQGNAGYPEQNGYYQQNAYPQSGYPEPSAQPQPYGNYLPGSYGEATMPVQQSSDPMAAYHQQPDNGYAGQAAQPHSESVYPPYEPGSYASGYRPTNADPAANNYRTQAAPGQPARTGKGPGGPSPNVRNLLISVITLLVVAAGILMIATANNGGNPGGNNGNGPQVGAQTGTTVSKGEASAYASKFLPNVYVDGICLADMTFQEGSDAVWAQAREKQSSWYVRLKNENGSYKDITADMLGISFDPTSALQQAWAIGHTPDENGQVTDKALQQAVNAALVTEYHFTSAQQSANTSPIDTILDTLQTNAYRAPQDAVILSFNPDDFVNPFTFQQEVWGQWLDVSAVKQEILNKVSTLESGEVLLTITPIAPNVTVADLQKTVTLRCRAVTPISSSSTEDRTNNIRVAFSKINGKSLAHGDKFSFNKFVGRRTLENGFFQAIEYAYGEEVMGVGGGVCQASTTVYLAAIQSGMTITNREAHSNPVNYTSLGMDATVSDTRGREVDFTFKNESGGRIFIAAHVVESGSNRRSLLCEVRIYGPSLEDVHYKLESETVEVLPKPEEPKLKEDKTGEHAFYIDETKQASKGREGYVVDTYLCTYQGDTLISREKISRDTYPARQDVYWVGVNFR